MDDSSAFRPNVALGVLVLAVMGLIIAQIYTVRSLRSVESKLASVEDDQAKAREAADKQAAQLREASVAADAAAEAAHQKSLIALREEANKAGRQAQGIAVKAKEEALKGVEDLANRVNVSESKLKEQQETDARVANEITGLKQSASAVQSDVTAVSTEVKAVKTEVAATKSQLERTIADLGKTTGDMGVLSGLIATNAKEVAALKELGDRNYVEFMLFKRKDPVRLGEVYVLLKKTDVKNGRYTVELRVDDRTIEKKDRAVNEPVQFYVGKSRQLHEFVVNQVGNDQIVGYLATPKVAAARP